MTLLKELIEDIVNENDQSAKISFHTFLTDKMKTLTEMESGDTKWVPGSIYEPNEMVLSSNKNVSILGPVSYEEYVQDNSEADARAIKNFKPNTWIIDYNDGKNHNFKILNNKREANKFVEYLKSKLSK